MHSQNGSAPRAKSREFNRPSFSKEQAQELLLENLLSAERTWPAPRGQGIDRSEGRWGDEDVPRRVWHRRWRQGRPVFTGDGRGGRHARQARL